MGMCNRKPLRLICPDGDRCPDLLLNAHCADFSHPGDSDYRKRSPCPEGELCLMRELQGKDKNVCLHHREACHPGDADYSGPREPCPNAICTDKSDRHLRRFRHANDKPDPPLPSRLKPIKRAILPARSSCIYGLRCYRTCSRHAAEWAHPGDHDYRHGLVMFLEGHGPEFETLRQLFDYCDAEFTGYFTNLEQLSMAVQLINQLPPGGVIEAKPVWQRLDGDTHGFVGFGSFSTWAEEQGVPLPVGVHIDGDWSCGFVFRNGNRCPCTCFRQAENKGVEKPPFAAGPPSQSTPGSPAGSQLLLPNFCRCGHRDSLHARRAPVEPPAHWDAGDGHSLAVITGASFEAFQQFVSGSHLQGPDNWTRDRGCRKHGQTCFLSHPHCCFKNKSKVPAGYELVKVVRNMNRMMWSAYANCRGKCLTECTSGIGPPYVPIKDLATQQVQLEAETLRSCNEWYLFHGTSVANADTLCSESFQLSKSGTGATWSGGRPLYGEGIYFAERVTKADEYAGCIEAGKEHEGCHVVLLCRVVGGRTQYCDTNEIDPDELHRQVITGPYHSVFGDRVAKLRKPYREIVVYDKNQVFVEYKLIYRRLWDGPPTATSSALTASETPIMAAPDRSELSGAVAMSAPPTGGTSSLPPWMRRDGSQAGSLGSPPPPPPPA